MSRSRVVPVLVFFAALFVPVQAAEASYTVLCTGYASCESKGYSHAGYETNKSKSYWRMYTGTNCTNYVAYRLVTTNGLPNVRPKAGVGNAQDWGRAMPEITDSTPAVGSVAWWGRTGHHVAYVEKVVSPTEIWVSESNWSGAFDWRKIVKSGSGWPDGFMHFSDPALKNTTKPSLGATPKVGVPLTPSVGKWTIMGNTYQFQWKADGVAISGATAKSYTPAPAVVGKALSVTVTASRPNYSSGTATSAAATVQPGTLQSTAKPTVSGTPEVGATLTAQPGSWSEPGLSYDYQWLVDGREVKGATDPTYSLVAADRTKPVSVRVTAGARGYTSSSATSAETDPVDYGTIPSFTPKITGSARLGSTLSADAGPRSVPGATATYQWLRGGEVKAGATSPDRKVILSDLGRTLSIRVTWTAPGYTARTATSQQTETAKASATLKVTAAPATGKVRFSVALPVTGMADPSATIVLSREGGGQVSFPISKGAGSFTLLRQPRGTNTYTLSYAGTSKITSAKATITSKVK